MPWYTDPDTGERTHTRSLEGEYRTREDPGGFQDVDKAMQDTPILGPLLSDVLGINEEAQREAADRERRMADFLLRAKYQTEGEGIYEDPNQRLRADDLRRTNQDDVDRQMQALRMLQEAGRGGPDAIDAQKLREMRSAQGAQNAMALRQGRAAAQGSGMGPGAAAIGQAGVGMRGAAGAMGATDAAAQARALQMLRARGQMASGMRRQDNREGLTRAQAQDERTLRDVGYRQGVYARNADRQNTRTAERAGLATGMAGVNDSRAARQRGEDQNTLTSIVAALL